MPTVESTTRLRDTCSHSVPVWSCQREAACYQTRCGPRCEGGVAVGTTPERKEPLRGARQRDDQTSNVHQVPLPKYNSEVHVLEYFYFILLLTAFQREILDFLPHCICLRTKITTVVHFQMKILTQTCNKYDPLLQIKPEGVEISSILTSDNIKIPLTLVQQCCNITGSVCSDSNSTGTFWF